MIQIPDSVFKGNVLLKLAFHLVAYGGLNLLINNIRDIRTSSRLEGIAGKVQSGTKEEKIEALSDLYTSDYEFLARRVEKGPVRMSLVSRHSSRTHTVLKDDYGIKLLGKIAKEAIKYRDELAEKGVYVPPADWFAQRLGVYVGREENKKHRAELSDVVIDTVESFRALENKGKKEDSLRAA